MNSHPFIIYLLSGCLEVPVKNQVGPQDFGISLVQNFWSLGEKGR